MEMSFGRNNQSTKEILPFFHLSTRDTLKVKHFFSETRAMEAPQCCTFLQSTTGKSFTCINCWCNLQAEVSRWTQWEFDPFSKQIPLPWTHLLHHTPCYLFPSFPQNDVVLMAKTGLLGFVLRTASNSFFQPHLISVPPDFSIQLLNSDKTHLSSLGGTQFTSQFTLSQTKGWNDLLHKQMAFLHWVKSA